MWQAGFVAIPSYPTIQNPVRIRRVVHQSYVQQIGLTCNFTNHTNLLVLFFCPTYHQLPIHGLASQHLIARNEKQRYEQVQAYALKEEIFVVEETVCLQMMHICLTTGTQKRVFGSRKR